MRISLAFAVPLALLVGLLLGAAPGPRPAGAEEPADALLQLMQDVAVLKERQAAIRGYVLANAARADRLDQLVADLRRLGFAAAANPAPARERLLAGLTEMAKSLREGLPAK
jgi:hypothetical protein